MEGDQEWTEDDKQTPSRPLVAMVECERYSPQTTRVIKAG